MAKFSISINSANSVIIGDNNTINVNRGGSEEECEPIHIISGPKAALPCASNCYEPDYKYYGRKKLDEDIQKIKKGKLTLLHGTIGTGKTSAALNYICKNKQNFSISWCIDIASENEGTSASLTDLTEKLGVKYSKLFDTIQERAENESIIFLLDNVQEKPDTEWFRKLWSIRGSVYLIMTTNNASLNFPDADKLSVEKFEDAETFLLEADNSKEDVYKLCEHFGWNILGLTAAKVYMLRHKVSARDYLNVLGDKEASVKLHLAELSIHKRTLFASVRACLEDLDRDKKSAIFAISFMSHNMIPEFLLSSQLSSDNQLENSTDLNDLHDQLKSLVRITKENDLRFFSFHSFTQYVIRHMIRDMINESDKADLLYKMAGTFVRHFWKDNRFSKGDFLQRIMREHAEIFLREWEEKQKDDRTCIALARLSELLGFTYTQQQPPVQDKLDVHFKRARAFLHKLCGVTEQDLQPTESLLETLSEKVKEFLSISSRDCLVDQMYGITKEDLAVSRRLFKKLTKKSSELPNTVIDELVFSRTMNKQDLVLFPESVKNNEELRKKVDSLAPLSSSDVDLLVKHGVAQSVEAYRSLFLPELYLSVVYSLARNYFYNKENIREPRFYVDLLRLAYCISREINEKMDPGDAVLHEYLAQGNGLLYLLVNDTCIGEDGTCVKKQNQLHARDLENAISRYQHLITDDRRFFEMGILKRTKDDRYSKLVCLGQILQCYEKLLSMEHCDQYIEDGLTCCNDMLELLGTYVDGNKEDLVRHSKHLNAIAKFYLRVDRREYCSRAIELFTVSSEYAMKYDVTLFYIEALVGLAEIFSRIGRRRFTATLVSIRHLKQCHSKEAYREMLRQKPHIQEKVNEIQKQNLASVVKHCVLRRKVPHDEIRCIDEADVDQLKDKSSSAYDDFRCIDVCDTEHLDSKSSSGSASQDEISDDDSPPKECSGKNTAGVCDDGARANGNKDVINIPSDEIPADEKVPGEELHVSSFQHTSRSSLFDYSSRTSRAENNAEHMVLNQRTGDTISMYTYLLKLAGNIPKAWKKMAIFLNISNNKIDQISSDHPGDVEWQAYKMLECWWRSRDRTAQPWQEELASALQEIGRNDLVEEYIHDVLPVHM